MPASTSSAKSGGKLVAYAARARQRPAPPKPTASTVRSPMRSVSRPQATSVRAVPMLTAVSRAPVATRLIPSWTRKTGPNDARPCE